MDPTDTSKRPAGDFAGNDAAKRIQPNESPFTERGRGRGGGFGRGHLRGSSSANGRGIARGFRGGFGPRGGRGFVRGGWRGRGFNNGGAGITRGGRGLSRSERGAPRGGGKSTSDTKEGKMKTSHEKPRELHNLDKEQLKGIKLECEIEQSNKQSSEKDFPGYPGWSQASLLRLLREFSTSLNYNSYIWDKFDYPGRTSRECRRVWQKFEQDVQLSVGESLSCVKAMLMETVPSSLKPEKVHYQYPWQMYARNVKFGGRSIDMKGSNVEQMFHLLEENVKAAYEVLSLSRWKRIHTRFFYYCKEHPECLGKKFKLGRHRRKYF